jgi:two-component system response regulator FixJ
LRQIKAFRFQLQQSAGMASIPSKIRDATLPCDKGLVVIVDDDLAVLTSLKFSLEIEGYAVQTFSDAQSLLRNPSVGRNALLVIDYRLPDTNGFDLLERLRAKGVRAPAILITSAPSDALRRRAAGMRIPIIEKPLLDNSLIAALREQRDLFAKGERF